MISALRGARPTHPELLDLPRRPIYRKRLVDQGATPADHAIADLSTFERKSTPRRPSATPTTDGWAISAGVDSMPRRSAIRCCGLAAISIDRLADRILFRRSRPGDLHNTLRSRLFTRQTVAAFI